MASTAWSDQARQEVSWDGDNDWKAVFIAEVRGHTAHAAKGT